MFIILQIFCNDFVFVTKMFINSLLFAAFDVYFSVFSGTTLIYEQTKMSLLL